MRIAQIAPPWLAIPPKNYGGTENVIYQLVEALVAEGHDVTLLGTGDCRTSANLVSFIPRGLLDENVPWSAQRKAYYHLHKAIEYLSEQNFDIVHAHLSSDTDLFLLPLLAAVETPHLATLHSNLPLDTRPGRAEPADELYQEWASVLPMVAISESASRQQALPLNFVGVVHHGLNLELYHPPRRSTESYFVWLGRFSPEKGAHLAIEAARRANVPLILAGTIDTSKKQTREYFHKTIKPQIDNDQIRYLGPVNTKRKTRLLGRARGFLNPIEWEEPFGMVMIEAMAMGCPVISFTRGAAPEIISHERNGFLVSNLDEMVQYIPRVNELDRAEVRAHVEECFSAEAMARNYLRMYEKMIVQHTQEQVGASQEA
jgi:glycosyltransferase involved in cell wall biosynthesis